MSQWHFEPDSYLAMARPVPLEEGVDRPSSVDDQLAWLAEAGLQPAVIHVRDDLAIIVGDRAGGETST
jgi:hypothetical protein